MFLRDPEIWVEEGLGMSMRLQGCALARGTVVLSGALLIGGLLLTSP